MDVVPQSVVDTSAEPGSCVFDSCQIAMQCDLGEKVRWSKLSLARTLADKYGFAALNPRRFWDGNDYLLIIDKDGRWLNTAIEALCRRAEQDFCGIFQVAIR